MSKTLTLHHNQILFKKIQINKTSTIKSQWTGFAFLRECVWGLGAEELKCEIRVSDFNFSTIFIKTMYIPNFWQIYYICGVPLPYRNISVSYHTIPQLAEYCKFDICRYIFGMVSAAFQYI